jgi:hypothetical protein
LYTFPLSVGPNPVQIPSSDLARIIHRRLADVA